MGAILEYKCPCCSGPLQFDTDAQKMKCPYCDNEFDAETLKSNDDILKEEKPDMMDWSSQPGNEWMQGELEGQKVYLCNSCGGQIVCDDTTGATDRKRQRTALNSTFARNASCQRHSERTAT